MTQKTQIFEYLKDGNWVCGTVFQDAYIPEYRSIIGALRREGHTIDRVSCDQHKHNSKNLKMWRLVPVKMDSSQTATKFFQDFPIREVKTKAILF